MKHTFSMVKVGYNSDSENYTIKGLPENKPCKPENFTEIEASYLSVNGVGFACRDSSEFSQYDTTITVEQKTDSGSANIKLPT